MFNPNEKYDTKPSHHTEVGFDKFNTEEKDRYGLMYGSSEGGKHFGTNPAQGENHV